MLGPTLLADETLCTFRVHTDVVAYFFMDFTLGVYEVAGHPLQFYLLTANLTLPTQILKNSESMSLILLVSEAGTASDHLICS